MQVISYLKEKHIMHKNLSSNSIFIYKDTIKVGKYLINSFYSLLKICKIII